MQHDQPPLLPDPDPDSAAHSERVAAYIREQIVDSDGSISFAEFMQYALYAPGLGYYTAGSTKLGASGDFVTAPEVSAVFGGVVARQVAEVLRQVGNGEILEYGAGSGKLAADVLETLQRVEELPSTYQILEVSPDLRERQELYLKDRIPELVHLVSWLDSPPTDLRGAVLANEVLDALPVERFVRRAAGVMQQRVVLADHGFEFAEGTAPARLAAAVVEIENDRGEQFADGFVSEICLAVPGWIEGISMALQEGVAFLFDYGVSQREYYAPERSDGWLRCHFRHHAHNNALMLPGIQDLTAWVDFTAVASAGAAAGFDVAGFAAQAPFLMAGGLEAEMQGFAALSLEQQLELSRQVKTLTLPGEMGEYFKCLALSKGKISTPSGFGMVDRVHTL